MYDYLRHPHVVNNCVKRHLNVPTYSMSEQNVLINEYDQMPQYQMPYMQYQQPYYAGQMPNSMTQYQGNVGVEGYQQQMANPYMMPQYPTTNMPFNY